MKTSITLKPPKLCKVDWFGFPSGFMQAFELENYKGDLLDHYNKTVNKKQDDTSTNMLKGSSTNLKIKKHMKRHAESEKEWSVPDKHLDGNITLYINYKLLCN